MSEESKSWYQMTHPLFNSGFEDDEFWAYGQDGFQEVLDSFIGTDVLIYDKAMYTEPQRVRAIIQSKTSDVYNSTTIRQILCNIGILKCGQYVECDGATWLVSALPDNNRIYEKAVLWKCKHSIRFISPLTGEIVSYPVFSTNSTQYGTGEAEKTHMNVGEDQHLIYLPFNQETILLDDNFRFIMDKKRIKPSVYRVTRVDPVSYAVGEEREQDGLIQWSVLEDQLNTAKDNIELMVADYYPTIPGGAEKKPGATASLSLTDLDGDFMLASGETKQVEVRCMDANGDPITPPQYRLECDFAGGAASIIDETNSVITLQASTNLSFVGKQIKIKAVNDAFACEAAITIQIVNW